MNTRSNLVPRISRAWPACMGTIQNLRPVSVARKKMDKRQKSAAYLDGLVSANTSVSKYADPIAAEPSDALAPALEHADARARLLASLKSHKHKEMVQAGMNVSINVQRVRVP